MTGLDEKFFLKLVDDKDSDYCLDDATLDKILLQLAPSRVSQAPSKGESTMAKGRAVLAQELFNAADRNGNGFLDCNEMFEFAKLIGFPPGDPFDDEHKELCRIAKCDPSKGLDEKAFTAVANDQAGDYYIEDKDLPGTIQQLGQTGSEAKTPAQQLRQDIFEAADRNRDGFLDSSEMYAVAQVLQYGGPQQDFAAQEFQELCQSLKCNPEQGVNAKLFVEFTSDPENDFAIEDGQLASHLEQLKKLLSKGGTTGAAPAKSEEPLTQRQGLMAALFANLDIQKSKRLTLEPLYLFAQLVGFPGSSEEFQEEYDDICKNSQNDPKQGVDEASFSKLANDSDSDYFVEDAQFQDILLQLMFKSLDKNGDGYLDCLECTKFAQAIGFQGSAEDFKEEWVGICTDMKIKSIPGITMEVFQQMATDPAVAGGDYNINIEELASTSQFILKA